jgi:hypothetical protein
MTTSTTTTGCIVIVIVKVFGEIPRHDVDKEYHARQQHDADWADELDQEASDGTVDAVVVVVVGVRT